MLVHKVQKRLPFLLVLILVPIGFLFPPLQTAALINIAQLMRVHGVYRSDLFDLSLNLSPENRHVRLQTGNVYMLKGDVTTASAIFSPLAISQTDPVEKLGTIIALTGEGETAAALSVFKNSGLANVLPRGTAIRLLDAGLEGTKSELPISDLLSLFVRGFGLEGSAKSQSYFDYLVNSPDSLANINQIKSLWSWRVSKTGASSASNASRQVDCVLLTVQHRNEMAEMLGVNSGDFTFGKDLSVNGDFEDFDFHIDQFRNWRESYMSTGKPWNFGLFIVGSDWGGCRDGVRALRIDGLSIENLVDREPARAGLWSSTVEIPARSPYLLSFVYRTEETQNFAATIYLSDSSGSFNKGDMALPPTHGRWKRVLILAWNNTSTTAAIQPLLRSFSTGSVHFDNFEVRRIELKTQVNQVNNSLVITEP